MRGRLTMLKKSENVTTRKTTGKSVLSHMITFVCVACALYSVYGIYQQNRTGDLFFFFGYRPVVIVSGSMEDTIETGAIVLTKQTTDIKEGDILFFKNNEEIPIVHRCVRIDGNQYYTKGDHNKSEDWEPVTKDNIYGKVIFRWNAIAPLIRNLL